MRPSFPFRPQAVLPSRALILGLALSLLPAVVYEARGLGERAPGHWSDSGGSISCGNGRVCADWIDDDHGYLFSCCIPASYVGTNYVQACSHWTEYYGPITPADR